MDEVERADIQRRRDPNVAAALDQPFDEIEAGLAVIQAAIDMSTGNV